MLKIWAKLEKDDKIVKSEVFTFYDFLNDEYFKFAIASACHKFDVPTPIILSKHLNHFVNFNNTVFVPEDFVESFNFDKLTIENAADGDE